VGEREEAVNTVWKFPLTSLSIVGSPRTIIKAPGLGHTVLVGSQYREWYAWCEVDTDKREYAREFLVVGTGHPMPDDDEGFIHVGSWQDEPFVWHAYQRPALVD
jgi:hypothetical protein